MSEFNSELNYQYLSKTAVVATIVSVIGLLGLLVPLLALISLIGLVLSGIALSQISRSDGTLSGRGMARVSLFISLAVLGNAIGYQVTKSNRLAAEARKKAEVFIEHVAAGERKVAHQLMLPVEQRAPQGVGLEFYYQQPRGDSTPQTQMESTFQDTDMKRLVEYLESGARPQFIRSLGTTSKMYAYNVNLEYKMPDGEVCMITMCRTYRPETKQNFWNFVQVRWKES